MDQMPSNPRLSPWLSVVAFGSGTRKKCWGVTTDTRGVYVTLEESTIEGATTLGNLQMANVKANMEDQRWVSEVLSGENGGRRKLGQEATLG